MKKIITAILVLGSMSAFAQANSFEKCSAFIRAAIAQDLVCAKQVDAFGSASSDQEINTAAKNLEDCFDTAGGICVDSSRVSSGDSVFEKDGTAQGVLCQKEDDAVAAWASQANFQKLDKCLKATQSLYLKSI